MSAADSDLVRDLLSVREVLQRLRHTSLYLKCEGIAEFVGRQLLNSSRDLFRLAH